MAGRMVPDSDYRGGGSKSTKKDSGSKNTKSTNTKKTTTPNAQNFNNSSSSSAAAAEAARQKAEAARWQAYVAEMQRRYQEEERRKAKEKADAEKEAKETQEAAAKNRKPGDLLLDPTKQLANEQKQSKPANPAAYGNNPLLGSNGQTPELKAADPEQKIKWFVDNDGTVRLGEQSALAAPDPNTRQVATLDSLSKAGVGDPTKRGQTTGSFLAGTPAEVERQGVERKKKNDADALAAALKSSRKSAAFDGKFKQMSWNEYNSLSDRQRAAVNFNSIMQQAYERDNRDAAELGGKDKQFTLNEAPEASREGYRKAYEKLFGAGAADEEIVYAPKTVGVLSRLAGMDNGTAGLDEYLAGGGFITDEDLKSGVVDERKVTGPGGYVDPRTQWLNNIVDYQMNLEDTLAKGRVVIDGLKNKINFSQTTTDQLAGLVNNAANGLTDSETMAVLNLSGEGNRFGNGNGLDVSGLLSGDQQTELSSLNTTYEAMLQNPEFTDTLLKDEKFQRQVAQVNGLDEKRWLKLIEAKQAAKSGTTNTTGSEMDNVLSGNK